MDDRSPESRDTRWSEIKSILAEAADLDGEQRTRLLDERCAQDETLRMEIESLLAAHDAASGTSFFGVGDEPSRIGPYEILEPIARGGMGIVYLAEQSEPIRRRVAVKLIQSGMGTREVVARFELERQALAMMSHPNIAQVFDAGSTGDGLPYFVMEYVPGVPITRYCEKRSLDIRQRLRLFIDVCDAIQHAHQRGIVHRDIKPSNVLVTRVGESDVPKVIDFGIAKATSPELAELGQQTGLGRIVGTIDYLSPEQAAPSERGIDTRTDVYALGVLLYELLTGELPFRRTTEPETPLDELLRRVRTEDPVRPSSRVAEVDTAGRTGLPSVEPQALIRALRGDLDWIILRALEKDPERRYASASELSADIARHLSDEPVLARPPSVRYRAAKFVRRHRAAVAAMVVVAAVLAASVVVLLVKNREVREQRDTAERVGYVANVAAAESGLRNFELAEVKRRLAACPSALRGWEWRHLAHRSDMSERVLSGHTSRLYGVAVSPDGRIYASASVDPDNTVRLWDAESGRQLRELGLEEQPGAGGAGVRALAFSPDGRHLAWAVDDGRVIVSAVNDGRQLRQLRGHEARVNAVAYTPDGREIISASFDGTLRRWDAGDGEGLAVLRGLDGPVYGMAVCGDGSRIVSGGRSGTLRVWQRTTGVVDSNRVDAEILGVACSPDGSLFAAVLSDGTVRLWQTNQLDSARTIGRHKDGALAAVFSPDGRVVATAGKDRVIRFWDVADGTSLATLIGHEDFITSLAFGPEGANLVSASFDHTLRVWSADPKAASPVLAAVTEPVLELAVTPDGRRVVFETAAGDLHFVDTSRGAPLEKIPSSGRPKQTNGFELSADGTLLAALHTDVVRVWSLGAQEPAALAERAFDGATSIEFLPDGSELLVGTATNGSIHRWDVRHDRIAGEIATSLANVLRLRASPGGEKVVAFGGDWNGVFLELVSLRDGATMAPIEVPHLVPGSVNGIGDIAFSPDGSRIATVHMQDYALRLWDAADLSLLHTTTGHTDAVRAVAFSPDGARIATGGIDCSLRIWDGLTGQPLISLRSDGNDYVHDVAFTPDGKTVVSANHAGEVRAWRTEAPSR